MKKILMTVIITLIVLGGVVGGIVSLVVKTSGKGKTGKCEWQTENEKYKGVVCEAKVDKDQIVTIKLKNGDLKEALLVSGSAIKCSNKNNYFMCVGLRENCQVVNQKGPEFSAKCPVPWGPMEALMNFDIGNAKIIWER